MEAVMLRIIVPSLVVVVLCFSTHPAVAQEPEAPKPLPGGAIDRLVHDGPVHAVVHAPRGKRFATAADGHVILWDEATGRQLWQNNLKHHLLPRNLAFTRDGKTLAACGDFGFLMFWDVATGRATSIHPQLQGASDWWEMVFSRDGKYLALGGIRGEVVVCDGRTGKRLHTLDGQRLQVSQLAFAPDSKTLMVSSLNSHQLELWDPATGKLIRTFRDDVPGMEKASFSPDGKYLVARTQALLLHLWDWDTKKQVRSIGGGPGNVAIYTYAFSPDGHTIAVAQWNVHTVLLYETATGKERARFTGHIDRVGMLSFAANSRTVASAGVDRCVYVWDVTGRWQKGKWPAPELSDAELNQLWSDLGSDQADFAYQTVWKLALSPKQSVPFLADQFRVGPGPDAKQIARWIAELEDDLPAVRDKAFARLKRLGPDRNDLLARAKPRLPEAASRIQFLLDPRRPDPLDSANRLQLVRAVEALELAATPSARRVLRALVTRNRDDWMKAEARAALQRLKR
jgi:WD40 repeat protein